jgi:ATP-binding cassette subfamily F protein 3
MGRVNIGRLLTGVGSAKLRFEVKRVLLQLQGIMKTYGVETVLSDIDMLINERERVGLVGVNGAGKSTLVKMIAGLLSPDGGHIIRAKDTTIGYLAQDSGLQSERSIWEEALSVFQELRRMETELRQLEQRMAEGSGGERQTESAMSKYADLSDVFRRKGGYEYEAKARGVLHGMGFGDLPWDTPIPRLSGGQKTRLALAKLLLTEPDLLLLDEPTNHLDIPTLSWLEDYLLHYRGALLVVSHDRYFLDKIVNIIYEIERTQAKRYTGNYSRYMELKAEEYEIAMKHWEKQQGEIAKMEDFIQRNLVRATTTKRAQSRRKALQRMERLDRPQGDLKKAHFSFEIERQTGKDVLYCEELSAGYEKSHPLFHRISFDLKRGERVAIIGPNGMGKTTLLKTLIGQLEPIAGQFRWGSHVKLGFYDQEQKNLHPQKTVLDEVWDEYPHLEEVKIRNVLGNFLFSGDDVTKRISSLSGGEKARVSLAKLMLLYSNVLLMDEPTNHLDLFSKETLESALDDFDGTLLFISHDRYFLNRMADRIIELKADGIEITLGNYDDYVMKQKEKREIELERLAATQSNAANSEASPMEGEASGKVTYEQEKQQKRDERARQRRIEQVEAELMSLEEEIQELEAEIAQEEVYTNYKKLQEKNEALQTRREKVQQLYAEWEELLE